MTLPPYTKASWMGDLGSLIGDRLLGDIVIPGSHDAGAYDFTLEVMDQYQSPLLKQVAEITKFMASIPFLAGFIPVVTNSVLTTTVRYWGKAQGEDPGTQLSNGVRWLDLRTMVFSGTAYHYHGFIAHPVSETLDQVAAFTAAQPTELVLLYFSHMSTLSDSDHVSLVSMIASKLGSAQICQSLNDLQTKSLATLRAQGTRVVIFYDATFATKPSYPWLLSQDRFYKTIPVEKNGIDALTEAFNNGIAAYTGSMPLNIGFTLTPEQSDIGYSVANQFNPLSQTHDLRWFTEDARDALPGWMEAHAATRLGIVSTDFVSESALVDTCVALNAFPAPPPTPTSPIRLICSSVMLQMDSAGVYQEMAMPIQPTHGFISLAGLSAHDIYVVGLSCVAHYNGRAWSVLLNDGAEAPIRIRAFASNDVWTAGWQNDSNNIATPALLHYDGTNWTTRATLPQQGAGFHAIWGTSQTDLYVGGSDGNLYHYDGNGLTVLGSVGVGPQISDIWGTASNNLFVATNGGDDGGVWHWDGSQLTASTTGDAYTALWGSGSSLFAVGMEKSTRKGLINLWNGEGWVRWTTPTSQQVQLLGVGGSAVNAVTAVGVTSNGTGYQPVIFRYDGNSWTQEAAPNSNGTWLYGVWEQ